MFIQVVLAFLWIIYYDASKKNSRFLQISVHFHLVRQQYKCLCAVNEHNSALLLILCELKRSVTFCSLVYFSQMMQIVIYLMADKLLACTK